MATTAAPPDETDVAPARSLGSGYESGGMADDSVQTYLATIRRRWRRLAAIGAVAGLIVGVGTFLEPREYRATATFIANEEPSGGLGKAGSSIAGVASMLGMSSSPALSALSGGAKSPDFYGALLTSKDVLDSIVVTRYQTPKFTGDLVKFLKIKQDTRPESEFAALLKVKKRMLIVSVDPKTEMVGFTVTTTDADLSAQIARNFLNEINQFNGEHRRSTAGQERQFAEQRKTEALGDLSKAEQTLADFDTRNRSVNQSPLLMTQRQGLERRIEIAEQVYMQLVQEYESSRIEEVRNTPVITVVDNPERLIEPIPRNTVLKAMVASLMSALIALIYLINAEQRRARRRQRPVDGWRASGEG